MEKKQMSAKKWTVLTICVTVALLLMLAVVMYITDPLLYFRKETKILSLWEYNQLYSGPGVARYYDYDTVVTGSCMVQQFDTRMIDEAYDANSVKLTYNGATAYNVKTILDICFETHPEIKRAIIPMDIFLSVKDVNEYSYPLPEYMYEKNLGNSVKYLLNANIAYHQLLPNVIGTLHGETHLAMEAEPENHEYGATLALSEFTPTDNSAFPVGDPNLYRTNTEQNLEQNILPLIEAHPNTEFQFFVPSYSILYWGKLCKEGIAKAELESLRMMMEACLPYDNVTIYSYLWDEEIITDLNNYRDVLHFSPEVQANLLDKMTQNIGLITQDNYNQLIDEFYEMVSSFDYIEFCDSWMQKLQ